LGGRDERAIHSLQGRTSTDSLKSSFSEVSLPSTNCSLGISARAAVSSEAEPLPRRQNGGVSLRWPVGFGVRFALIGQLGHAEGQCLCSVSPRSTAANRRVATCPGGHPQLATAWGFSHLGRFSQSSDPSSESRRPCPPSLSLLDPQTVVGLVGRPRVQPVADQAGQRLAPGLRGSGGCGSGCFRLLYHPHGALCVRAPRRILCPGSDALA